MQNIVRRDILASFSFVVIFAVRFITNKNHHRPLTLEVVLTQINVTVLSQFK